MQKRFHPQLSPALWAASAAALSPFLTVSSTKAQVVPSADGTSTTVVQNGSNVDIEGGTRADGNLFHKFDEFSIDASETANFTSDSNVFNIVGQVSGGNPSYIEGQVQVSGSDADLYLVNPAGVLFGPDAQLSLSGSFTATSADQVGFGEAWLDVLEEGADYSQLVGAPSGFRFSESEASAIVNQANLSVAAGESLTLMGGSVVGEGDAVAPGGEVGLVAVGGESTVRFTPPGSLLSLEIAQGETGKGSSAFVATDLPTLLTGRTGVGANSVASRLSVDGDGTVRLLGRVIEDGEVAIASNISASSSVERGGTVVLLGNSIEVLEGTIDASGTEGGAVRIGGGIGGDDNLPTAETLLVESGVTVLAEGSVGNGGNIVAFAEDTANLQGLFSAQGNLQGGFVETSADFLDISDASVVASGQEGGGAWFIDPVDVEIVSGASGVNQIDTASIVSSLDSGVDVVIDTSNSNRGNGDITLRNSINQTGVSSANLTLTGRRFDTNGSTINLASTGQLTFNLNAINPEATTNARAINRAITAIGNVSGDRLINLGAGTYEFGGIQAISTDVDIVGDSGGGTILTALNNERLFDVYTDVTARLSDLTFTTTGALTGPTAGGLRNAGNLTVENSRFQNNRGVFGGAINSLPDASLTIVDSSFIDNIASEEGGAISASDNAVSIVGSTFSGNASAVLGGAVRVDRGAQLTIDGSTFSGNDARTGGGVSVTGGSEATITNSTFTGNMADVLGGGLYVETGKTVDILGTTFDANTSSQDGGGITLRGSNTTTLTNSALINNVAGDDGGGLHHVDGGSAVLTNVRVENNSASDTGGGLYQFDSADLTIVDSLVRGNQAGSEGGGLMNNAASAADTTIVRTDFEGNTAQSGGGLFSRTDGTVSITDSDFVDNEATQFDGGGIYTTSALALNISGGRFDRNATRRDGGAIAVLSGDRLNIENSTFANNTALFDDGGGLFVQGTSLVTVTDSLFDGNEAADDGGGIYAIADSQLTLGNTTLTNNTVGGGGGGVYTRTNTTVTIEQNSIISDNSAGIGGGIAIDNTIASSNVTSDLGSELTVVDSVIRGNSASERGGGIANMESSRGLTVVGTTLERNVAPEGGGIFSASSDAVTLDSATFSANESTVGNGGAIAHSSSGILTVSDALFEDNQSNEDGGAIFAGVGSVTAIDNTTFQRNQAVDAGGALIVREGTVDISETTIFSGNSARDGGALLAFGSVIEIADATFDRNTALEDGGGVVAQTGSVATVSSSRFTRNTAGDDGGGFYATGNTAVSIQDTQVEENSAVDAGGGIYASDSSSLSVERTTVERNRAADGGGFGLRSSEATISDSAVGLNQASNNGGGWFQESGLLTVSNVAFDGNTAVNDGGAIALGSDTLATVEGSTLEANEAAYGGGISGRLSAEIALRDSVIRNNSASVDGGGVRLAGDVSATIEQSQFSNNTAQFGGGLELSTRSSAAVADTTFSTNEAILYGGAVMVGDDSNLTLSSSTLSSNRANGGGGISVTGMSTSTLVNATLSNNTASQNGGGVRLFGPDAMISVRNSTLTENVAASSGGGIASDETQATAELLNTIVAGNSAGAAVRTADISGRVVDAGNNLVGIAETSTGLGERSLAGTSAAPLDPGLEALAGNGGQTETYLLRADSVAINAGNSSQLPATDQRGFARVAGAAVDIGAVEMAATELPSDVFDAIAPNVPVVPPETATPDPAPLITPPDPTPPIPADNSLTGVPVAPSPQLPDSSSTISNNLLDSLSLDFPSPAEIDEAAVAVLPEVSRSERNVDNQAVQKLEQTFGQSFKEYWDLSLGPDLSFDEVQSILRQAKEDYEVSSAVIYAAFSPVEDSESDENDLVSDRPLLDVPPESSDDDQLNLSLVMPEGELVSYPLPFTRKQVTRQAMLFRSMASDPVDDFSYQPFARRVYEWLLAPLEEDLAAQGIQNLMYALDTGLRTAPITAMRDDSGYALERFGMSVIPNVGLMQADFGASVGRSTVAMGVAEFESKAPLPAVPVELAMVDEYVVASQTLLNEGTTFDALESVQSLAQPGSLHLATHAHFDASSPDSSYIQLWNDPLSMTEFRQIDWQGSDLNLLILSACSTAMSSPQAELGFAGLAAASGVDATVGSLWQVSDVGTLALMSEFYAQLGSSDFRFEALRRAQLALMKGETRIEDGKLITSRGEVDLPDEWDIPSDATLDHPFFWSAFTMVGNPW